MRPDIKDSARLWDMLDSARTVIEFTSGQHFEEFLHDRKTRNAVERNFEIIGEAARCVSPEARELLSEIPWKSIIGLRNVLTHEYGEIRYEILWSIIKNKLPALIQKLEETGIDNPPPLRET